MQSKKYIIYYTIGSLLLILIILTVFFFLTPTSSVFAVESKSNKLGISTNPTKELLRVKNMAPGDNASAPLTVLNTGKKDFFYNISAEMESGDKLYNYLDLVINDQNHNELYSGKLKDLNDLDLGILGNSKNKIFNVTIGLPSEAGNEYQEIFTSMKFILNATDQPSSHNCFRPPFSNRNYSMKRGSSTPIKFECYDSDGNLLTSSHNVKLVITGRDLREGLTYNLENGLSLNGGHYQANVYADQNLFFDNETYTATVYSGSQMYGQKTFSTEPGNRSNAP
ncbi:hypothetical protein [Desulfosporosinus sp. BG]|uniref:hypothetical protein n=1 Tax=Desulfosporosinus sp. BG TaxID=1633135 RepID=UPI00083B3B58|nr:hypothetical protein [Desulfosporosinus sp. BG]ODA41472.1 hypothetical protein DSBG_1748 [Desulfosporosinus sp. BG]